MLQPKKKRTSAMDYKESDALKIKTRALIKKYPDSYTTMPQYIKLDNKRDSLTRAGDIKRVKTGQLPRVLQQVKKGMAKGGVVKSKKKK
jgi:hypothetical protein